MSLNLREVVEFLVDNGYVSFTKRKLAVFTKKFNEEFSDIPIGLDKGVVVHPDNTSLQTATVFEASYEEAYTKFLLACNIPRYSYDSFGKAYSINKYSEEGMKAFKKALQSGYKLELLQATIMLYYKSSTNYKKAVGNYLSSGEWKTDYDNIVKQAEAGTLKDYVRTETHERTLPGPTDV